VHTKIVSPQILHDHDRFIMDLAHEQGVSLKILQYINKFQMNLQVLTLTDITTESGTMIVTYLD
jgi:hypothetical protein